MTDLIDIDWHWAIQWLFDSTRALIHVELEAIELVCGCQLPVSVTVSMCVAEWMTRLTTY